jgi:hypothetical protein
LNVAVPADDDALLVKLVLPSAVVAVLEVVMLYGIVTVTGTVNKQPLLASALSVAVTIVKCEPGVRPVGSTCSHINTCTQTDISDKQTEIMRYSAQKLMASNRCIKSAVVA